MASDDASPPSYEETIDDRSQTPSLRSFTADAKYAPQQEPPQPAQSVPEGLQRAYAPQQEPPQPTQSIPEGLQRAYAPLQIDRHNDSIRGDYLIIPPAHGAPLSPLAPHVDVVNRNGSIELDLWAAERGWETDGPFRVKLENANGKITAGVHTLDRDQPIDMFASTRNSAVNISIPHSFRGTITMSRTNGRVELSPALRRNSIRVSSPDDKNTERYEIGSPGGPSRLEAKTLNGSVRVGYVDERAGEKKEEKKEEKKKGLWMSMTWGK